MVACFQTPPINTHKSFPLFLSSAHANSEEYPAWVNASYINTLDIQNEDIIFLAKQLSPAILRLGGSEEDQTFYAMGGQPCPANNTAQQWCLTEDRWKDLNTFAEKSELNISFGLNFMYERWNSNDRFNPEQVSLLFNTTVKQGLNRVTMFQCGNELENKVSAQPFAEDVKTVRALLNAAWPDASTRPQLVAPDENPVPDYLEDVLKLLPSGTIDGVTWHSYDGNGIDPNLLKDMETVDFYQKLMQTAQPIIDIQQKYGSSAQLWVGETAAAWHSGRMNVTNAVVSTFWYATQLSLFAPTHHGQCRQCLVGGYYELIDKFSHQPNPDYYMAILWKRLIGGGVLSTSASGVSGPLAEDVYSFAFCASDSALAKDIGGQHGPVHDVKQTSGALVIVAVNIGEKTTNWELDVSVQGKQIATTPRTEYVLTAPNNDLSSRTVLLNGAPLKYTLGSNSLPPMPGKSVTSPSPVVSPQRSVSFIVFPNAGVSACN